MRLLVGIALTLALLCVPGRVSGQQATERYIPIGRSPGVSDTSSWAGEIESVVVASRTLHVIGAAGQRSVSLTDRTRIWLDRSGAGRSNQTGSLADCRAGRRVEVHYADPEQRSADWIKIRVE